MAECSLYHLLDRLNTIRFFRLKNIIARFSKNINGVDIGTKYSEIMCMLPNAYV